MNETQALLIFDAGLFLVLILMLIYHIKNFKKDRKKTAYIRQELENEREKTNKFHVSVEEIRSMTKN
jgi:Na+/melibiose symporter-like transporter